MDAIKQKIFERSLVDPYRLLNSSKLYEYYICDDGLQYRMDIMTFPIFFQWRSTDHFFDRIDDRLTFRDNIDQCFQKCASKIFYMILDGSLKVDEKFFLVIDTGEEVLPNILCSVDNLSSTMLRIVAITYIPRDRETSIRRAEFTRRGYRYISKGTPQRENWYILVNPYVSDSQEETFGRKNEMKSFVKMQYCLYYDYENICRMENETFGMIQKANSARGFIRKAFGEIIDCILYQELKNGEEFYIVSRGKFFFKFKYIGFVLPGSNVKNESEGYRRDPRLAISFKAIELTTDENKMGNAMYICDIDNDDSFVTSHDILQRNVDKIKSEIGNDVLDRKSSSFKMKGKVNLSDK